MAMPDVPKVRGDLRNEVSKEGIDLVRHGLWMVVNGEGGTGAKARVKGIVVAGKTGSAQATDRGKEDMIAWFCCFAPYDKPRYVVCAMVQGGHHGGGVAGPIAQHILEQVFAMERGNYNVELTSLEPAHNPKPFRKDRSPHRLQDRPECHRQCGAGGGRRHPWHLQFREPDGPRRRRTGYPGEPLMHAAKCREPIHNLPPVQPIRISSSGSLAAANPTLLALPVLQPRGINKCSQRFTPNSFP